MKRDWLGIFLTVLFALGIAYLVANAQDSVRAITIDTARQAGVCYSSRCRSTTQRDRFIRLTGFDPKRVGGPRPGWIVDHMKPLECGGADLPSNMMWQTIAEADAKDRTEKDCSRWLR